MDFAADMIGALIATYFVSRAALWLWGKLGASSDPLVLAHLSSWILLSLVAFYLEVFSATAGIIYLPPQLLWFFVDRFLGERTSTT